MTPTKITLEIVKERIRLRVNAPDTMHGFADIESHPFKAGKSLPMLRKYGTQYAKRFAIPFIDTTL